MPCGRSSIPDDLVDEVAEVQHEAAAVCGGGALVLIDHAAIRVLRAWLTFWQLTNANSPDARRRRGAVMVPDAAPLPSSSVKRYQ